MASGGWPLNVDGPLVYTITTNSQAGPSARRCEASHSIGGFVLAMTVFSKASRLGLPLAAYKVGFLQPDTFIAGATRGHIPLGRCALRLVLARSLVRLCVLLYISTPAFLWIWFLSAFFHLNSFTGAVSKVKFYSSFLVYQKVNYILNSTIQTRYYSIVIV